MKLRSLRVLSGAVAASMLISGTAFAQKLAFAYNVDEKSGDPAVAVYNDSREIVGTDIASVEKVGDRYEVTFKNDVVSENETGIYGGIQVAADSDVKAGNITYKTEGRREVSGLVAGAEELTNIEVGDIYVEHDSSSAALAQVYGAGTAGDGTVNMTGGDVTSVIKDTGRMSIGVFAQNSGEYAFDDIKAESNSLSVGARILGEGNREIEFNAESLTGVTNAEAMTGTSGAVVEAYGDENTVALNVTGDISGTDAGILLYTEGEQNVIINCLGTVSGGKGAIGYQYISEDTDLQLNVWKIESENGVLIDSNIMSGVTYENDEDELKKINYILKTSGENCTIELSTDEGELGSTGDAFDEEYKTQNEGKKVIVTIKTAGDYEVSALTAGKNTDDEEIQAVKNSDGTWTIIVPRGGGIDIAPVLKAIVRNESTCSEWVTDKSGLKQYYKADGSLAKNEWLLAFGEDGQNAWYHFGKDTMMSTGWFTDENDGYTYYLDPVTGKMATGHVVIDGKEYYFNETVNKTSGWKKNSAGKWIYDKQSVIPLGALIG